jgi:hypothetical protein
MKVYDIAHARAGDKGNTSCISVFAYEEDDYDLLREQLTEERVAAEMDPLIEGDVIRHDLPSLNGFNFVIEGALDGGVTTSLRMDAHGKSFSYVILGIELSP